MSSGTSSPVRVIVESPDRTRRPSAAQRDPSGERTTAWMVITLVAMSSGLALFDLYLLLSGFR